MKFVNLLLLVFILISCSDNLPKDTLYPFPIYSAITEVGDSLVVTYRNSVAMPVLFYIYTNFPDINKYYTGGNPHHVKSFDSLRIAFRKPVLAKKPDSFFSLKVDYGDYEQVKLDTATRYVFPFPTGKSYKIVQEYNGSFSHKDDFARYAIDFDLAIGDTVCAARDGIVTGVIQGYNIGGNDIKYREYANVIMLYHADGTLTQYAHLKKNGSLVALGDTVKAGQPIGLAGVTGFTGGPHLHFNSIKSMPNGVIGFPIRFEKIDGKELTKGMVVE